MDMLHLVSRRRSLHMPGHQGVAPFEGWDPYLLDTTEISLSDDLFAPSGAIGQAQSLYADAAGAGGTLFLTGGATSGIHGMLQWALSPGDQVLVPRNCHLSVLYGCAAAGAEPVWLPVTLTEDGYPFLREGDVLSAVAANPQARALVITRPDYYGGCIPLQRIVAAAHDAGMMVLVDEAHGAHLPWSEIISSAGNLGADAWVQSVHKTLPGLTGSAVLHVRDRADVPALRRVLRRVHSSSPSFLLMASIDDARAYMADGGAGVMAQVAEKAEAFRSRLPAMGYHCSQAAWRDTGYDFDPLRLVIHGPQGGFRLQQQLEEAGWDVEMADLCRVVMILTPMTPLEALDDLAVVLSRLPREEAADKMVPLPCGVPFRAVSLREAVTGKSCLVQLAQAAGRISSGVAGQYPPGIPLICPGEVFTEELIDHLRRLPSGRRFGMEEECVWCLK